MRAVLSRPVPPQTLGHRTLHPRCPLGIFPGHCTTLGEAPSSPLPPPPPPRLPPRAPLAGYCFAYFFYFIFICSGNKKWMLYGFAALVTYVLMTSTSAAAAMILNIPEVVLNVLKATINSVVGLHAYTLWKVTRPPGSHAPCARTRHGRRAASAASAPRRLRNRARPTCCKRAFTAAEQHRGTGLKSRQKGPLEDQARWAGSGTGRFLICGLDSACQRSLSKGGGLPPHVFERGSQQLANVCIMGDWEPQPVILPCIIVERGAYLMPL